MLKKLLFTVIVLAIASKSFCQVSPYTIPPKWYVGLGCGIDFTSGTPVFMNGNPALDQQQENSSTMCDSARNIAFYSTTYRIFDQLNTQKLSGMCGNSSTGGSITFPDPASPYNSWYLVTADVDASGDSRNVGATIPGGGQNGINLYRLTKNGTTVNVTGPTNLRGPNKGEAISACPDGSGGYWILSHDGGDNGSNNYHRWRVTKTAGLVSATASTFTGSFGNYSQQNFVRVNQCMTKIAYVNWGGNLEVYNFNASSGTLGTLITTKSGLGNGYGLEFSPDGSKLYVSSLVDHTLRQIDLSGAPYTMTTVSTASSNNVNEIGALQLGYDNKIYVTNVANSGPGPLYVGVLGTPNNAAPGYNDRGFTYNSGAAGRYINRGIVNQSFIYPRDPYIRSVKTATSCDKFDFSYGFKTYYGQNITVKSGSESWDFGDGTAVVTAQSTPTHTFVGYTAGTVKWYVVKLTIRDQYCDHIWQDTIHVKVDCPTSTPVNFVSVAAKNEQEQVKVTWVTAKELNNAYFEVQRSVDGLTFESIGTVKGSGTSNSIKTYTYTDQNPLTGLGYYRIKQVDIDQTTDYSGVTNINFNKVSVILGPNPFANDFVVNVDGIAENATVNIYDAVGHLVSQTAIEPGVSVSVGAGLEKGTYIVEIIGIDINEHRKVIKE